MSKKKASSSAAGGLAGFGFLAFSSGEGLGALNTSPEYQLVFKKLTKRDSTTKKKGLKELGTMFDSLSEDAEGPVISRWAQELPKLIEDGDVRVRIHTLQTMEILAKKVGRRLAPHLKALLTPWLMAKFDSRFEVAQAATTTLNNCIAENKQPASILFCKAEIIATLQDHFQTYTIQYFTEGSDDSAKLEATEKYERLVASAVATLRHLIQSLPEKENAGLETKYMEVMDDKFWAFLTTKHAPIRAATYGLVNALLQSFPGLVERHLGEFGAHIFGALADKDPSTHSQMWGALIAFIKQFPSVWTWVSFKTSALPKLTSLLSNASYGSAIVSFPSLLPFVSLLPTDLLFDAEVHDKLLQSVWKALKSENLGSVKSGAVVVESYAELFLYTAIRLVKAEKVEQAEGLLKAHLAPIFEGFFRFEQILHPALPSALVLIVTKLAARPECSREELVGRLGESFRAIVAKVTAPASGPFQLQEQDPKQQAITCKHIGLFASELLTATAQTGIPKDFLETIRVVVTGLSSAGEKKYVSQVELIARLAPDFFPSLSPQFLIEYFEGQVSALLPVSNQNFAESGPFYSAIIAIADAFFNQITTHPESAVATKQKWSQMLGKWVDADLTGPLVALLKGLNTASSSGFSWEDEHLDAIALKSVRQILRADSSHQALAQTLLHSGGKYLSGRVRGEVETLVSHALADFAQAHPPFDSTPLTFAQRQDALAILDLAEDISSSLSSGALVSSLYLALDIATALFIAEDLSASSTGDVKSVAALSIRGLVSQVAKRAQASEVTHETLLSSLLLPFTANLYKSISSTTASIESFVAIGKALLPLLPGSNQVVSALLGAETEWVARRTAAMSAASQWMGLDWLSLPGALPVPSDPTSTDAAIATYSRALQFAVALVKEVGPEKVWGVDPANLSTAKPSGLFLFAEFVQALLFSSAADTKSPKYDHIKPLEVQLHGAQSEILSRWLGVGPLVEALADFVLASLFRGPSKSPLATPALQWILSHSHLNSSGHHIAGPGYEALFSKHFATPKFSDIPHTSLEPFLLWVCQVLPPARVVDFKRKSLDQLYSSDLSLASVAAAAMVGLVLTPVAKIEDADQRKLLEAFPNLAKHSLALLASHAAPTDQTIESLSSIARFCAKVMLEHCEVRLTEGHWTSLLQISESLLAKSAQWREKKTNVAFVAGLGLWRTLLGSDQIIPKLSDFSQRIFPDLFKLFVSNPPDLSGASRSLFNTLAGVLRRIPRPVLRTENFDLLHVPMAANHLETQWTAYLLLRDLVQGLVPDLGASKSASSAASAGEDTPSVPFLSTRHVQVLQDKAQYHSEANVVHLLFEWTLLLEFFETKNAEIKGDLSGFVRTESRLSEVLSLLFDHIPVDKANAVDSSITTAKIEHVWSQFAPSADHHDHSDSDEALLTNLSAFLFRRLLETLPALVRSWWSDNSNRLLKNQVDKFTTKHVSSSIISKELANLASYKDDTCDYYKIKVVPLTNEVTAIYKKDDVELNIILRIPSSYPLKSVSVEMGHKIGVQESTWRKWVLSMTTLLLTRDGTILDAVLLWKQYLDKHFEGVEVCPICYSMFQSSNHSLPNLPCKTCKNKFHSACLYKWFDQSHKNECPLCRTPFN